MPIGWDDLVDRLEEQLEQTVEQVVIGAFWLIAAIVVSLEWLFEGKQIR